MKQKIWVIASGLAMTTLITSCKKYLDIKSDAQLVVPTTLEDLQGLLDDPLKMNQGSPSRPESSLDDYFLSDNTYNSLSTVQQQTYTWTLKQYTYANDWSISYIPVYNSNICLERIAQIEKTPSNQDKWNNVKGSALFFRSYYYLNLCWEFSKSYDNSTAAKDPGIVLRTTTDFNVPSKRASVKQCYETIIKDSREAASLLPDNPVHVMRPSKAAAYGLLARTFLSMRQYDSCFKYANLCLQIKDVLMDLNGDDDINGSIDNPVPFKLFNKEVIFYCEMNRNIGLHMPYHGFIDTSLYASFAANDLRKSAFFKTKNGYHTFKGSYAASPNLLFTGIATNEILLTRAECYARANKVTEAMNDLNSLLEKRLATGSFSPITASNQTDAIQKILVERRKELLMHGLRWMDVKRQNKEGANITFKRRVGGEIFTLQQNDRYWAMPLPDDLIKLTGMEQN